MEILWIVICVAVGIVRAKPVELTYSTPNLAAVRSEPGETPGDADDAFQFAYAVASPEHGTYHGHQATRDQEGHTSGSYYALGADGNWRQTIYADKGSGFQALSNQRPSGSPPPQVSAVNYQIFVHPGATAISASGSGPPSDISLFRVKGAGRALATKNGLFLGGFLDDDSDESDEDDDDDDDSFSLESDYDNYDSDYNDDIFRQNLNFNFRQEIDTEDNENGENENDDDDENENESIFPKFVTHTATAAPLRSPISTHVSPFTTVTGQFPPVPALTPLSASSPTRIPSFVPGTAPAHVPAENDDENSSIFLSGDANSNENDSELPQHIGPAVTPSPNLSPVSSPILSSTPSSRRIPGFSNVVTPASLHNPDVRPAPTPTSIRIPAFTPHPTPTSLQNPVSAPAFKPTLSRTPAFAAAVTESSFTNNNLAFGTTPAPLTHFSQSPSPINPSALRSGNSAFIRTPSPATATVSPFSVQPLTPSSTNVVSPASPSFTNTFPIANPPSSVRQTSDSLALHSGARISSGHQSSSNLPNPSLNSASPPVFPFAIVPTSALSPVNTLSQQRTQTVFKSPINTHLTGNPQQSFNTFNTNSIISQSPQSQGHTFRADSQLHANVKPLNVVNRHVGISGSSGPRFSGQNPEINQIPLSAFVQNSGLTAFEPANPTRTSTIVTNSNQAGNISPVIFQTRNQQVNPSVIKGIGVPLSSALPQSSGGSPIFSGRANNVLVGNVLSHTRNRQPQRVFPIHSVNRAGLADDSVGVPLF